jgi:tetratricopeptide (TPR) repeat protein
MLVAGLVIGLVALFEYWQWFYGDWLSAVSRSDAGVSWSLENSRRIKSVLQNPNVLAYYLLFIVGLLLYKLGQSAGLLRRSWWAVCLVAALVIIFLTQSRGGLLGAVTLLTVYAGLMLLTATNWRRRALLPGFALLGLLAMLLLWPFVTRSVGDVTLNWGQRDDIWRIALEAIAAQPWLGSGPATFGQQYLVFRQPGSDFIHSHAHNLWLTSTAESGIVGLLAVLWLNLAFALAALRLLRHPAAAAQRVALSAVLAALAGVTVHNLFDDFLDYPMLTLHVIFFVALVLSMRPPDLVADALSPKMSHRLNLGAVVVTLVVGAMAIWFQPAFHAYDAARAAAGRDDWASVRHFLAQAVQADPGNRFYRQQLALTAGYAPSDFLGEAIDLQTGLLRQGDHYPLDYANLACLYWQADRLPEAIEAMEQAAARESIAKSQRELRRVSGLAYQFSLAQMLEQAGQSAAAEAILLDLLRDHPWFAASPFWAGRADQLQRMVQRISIETETPTPKLADLHYYAGNYRQAITLTAQVSAGERVAVSVLRVSRALAALGELPDALAVLDDALADVPHRAGLRLARAQLLMQQNKLDAAETDMQVVMAQSNSAEAYAAWGELAEMRGDTETAEQRYRQAIGLATALQTNYAHLIARREPLPEETLPCLIAPYAAQQLSRPALSLARLLEAAGNPAEAKSVYQFLLRHEPYNHQARTRLLNREGN